MHRRGLWVAATGVVLVAVGLALAGAASASGHEDSASGAAWTAVSLSGTGGTGEATVQATGTTPLSLGALVLDGHQFPLGPSVFVFDPFRHDVRATAGAAGVDVVDADLRQGDVFIRATLTVTWRGTSPGATVVLWSAGDVLETSWSVDGGEGATVLDTTSGEDTWLERNGDLGTGVEDWGDKEDEEAQRATVGLEHRSIDGSLVGVFTHGSDATDAMLAHTPDGVEVCPCSFAGSPPGAYAFLDAGYGDGEAPHVLFAGAGVRLPAPAR